MSRSIRSLGVISDTHGLVRPEALAALRGVDAVVHAGDVGSPDVLDALAEIAPVTAVRGNNDRGAWAARLPATATLVLAGHRIRVIHDRAGLRGDPATEGDAAVIFGHSHRPLRERRDGVLWLNPGSAGPRRFHLPVTVARLGATRAGLRARVLELDIAPPSSPAQPRSPCPGRARAK